MVNKADVIKLSDVTLTLESGAGPVNILKGINFAISEGQSVGIVGPSGSGKSSLMSLMTGLEQATTGDVVVDDLSFTGADEDTLARHRLSRVGIVMQAFHLIPTMTPYIFDLL